MRPVTNRNSIDGAIMRGRWGQLLALALVSVAASAVAQPTAVALDKIRLPPGFKIEVLARLDNPREMALGPAGTVFAGSMRAGNVYALTLRPGAPARVTTVASGLQMPVGVAFHGGALYVSATDRILRFDDIEHRLDAPPKPVLVSNRFPTDTHHGWKFITFGPDGKLYVPVGAPCNICEPDSDRYANLMRMNPDGSGLESPTPSMAASALARNSQHPRKISARMSRHSACASTPERNFRRLIASRYSLPSTDRGTAAARSATVSRS